MVCPQKNSVEWKDLVKSLKAEHGDKAEVYAEIAFHRNGDKMPESAKESKELLKTPVNIHELVREKTSSGIQRAFEFAKQVKTLLFENTLDKLRKMGIEPEARSHVYARLATFHQTRDLLAKVFPDDYKDPVKMAPYIDIINKNNIVGGYDQLVKMREDLSDRMELLKGKKESIESLNHRLDGITEEDRKDPVIDKEFKDIKAKIKWLKSSTSVSSARELQALDDRIANVHEAHDIDAMDKELKAAMKDEKHLAVGRLWKQHVVPEMDRLYNEMARRDPDEPQPTRGRYEELGQRINLLPMERAEEISNYIDANKTMPDFTAASSYRNPDVKGDPFARQAKLTGDYSTDAGLVLSNAFAQRMQEVTKLRLYDALKRNGAVEVAVGSSGPREINGQPAKALSIKVPETRGGKTVRVEKKLYVPEDSVSMLRRVLNTDLPTESNPISRAITKIQLIQISDASSHFKNMHTRIAAVLNESYTGKDLWRKFPGLASADAVKQMYDLAKEVAADTPEIRSEIAEQAKAGNIRSAYEHTGVLGKIGDALYKTDMASRILLNRKYSELVKANKAVDTPEARSKFIGQLGEYNRRLMGPLAAFLRDSGFSPFIVAGQNYNRAASRMALGTPTFEPVNGEVAVKTRINNIATLATGVASIAMFNYLLTGQFGGRKGTPLGAIDTGEDTKDGKRKVIDVFNLMGIRRGLRAIGANALIEGARSGESANEAIGTAFDDIVSTQAHPFMGPAPAAIYSTLSGKRLDLRSGSQSNLTRNVGGGAKQYAENFRVTLKNQNPLIYALASPFFGGDPVDTGGKTVENALLSPLERPVGYSEMRTPAMQEAYRLRNMRSAFTPEVTEQSTKEHKAVMAIRRGELTLRDAVSQGQITSPRSIALRKELSMSPLQYAMTHLEAEEAMTVWDRADAKERKELRPMIAQKISVSKTATPEQKQAMRLRLLRAN